MQIPYGDDFIDLKMRKEPIIIKMNDFKGEYYFDFFHFANFSKRIDNLLIIVNDHSRNTPTAEIISFIDRAIEKIEDIRFIIATGTHRATTFEEKKKIFGDYFYKYKTRITDHNGVSGEYDFYGVTSYNTKVYYNKILKRYNNILVIGGVETHYFAGFSGGRKSIFPGIAAYESIENNHKLALRRSAKIMSLNDNPVNLDMIEAVGLLKKNIYSIQVVNDKQGNIKFISQGNLYLSFEKAVNFAKKYYTVPIRNKVDLLLSIVEKPFDRNFYQAHKGVENTKSILKSGGSMILIAKCSEGIGNDSFYRLLKKVHKEDNIFRFIEKNYKLGYHKTAKIVEFLNDHRLILISDLEKSLFEGTKIELEQNLQKIYQVLEEEAKSVAVVFNAAICVPVISKF